MGPRLRIDAIDRARRRRPGRLDRGQRLLPDGGGLRRRRRAGGRPTSATRPSPAPAWASSAPAIRSTSSGPSGSRTGWAATSYRATSTRWARSSSPAPDLQVRMPADLLRYVVEKGSITVDGVSLTVVELLDDGFSVAVIPHTAAVDHARPQGRRRPREPRGRRDRQVRRAAARRSCEPPSSPEHRREERPDRQERGPRGLRHHPRRVAAIARGEIVVVVDDEDRENEGDLIMAAEAVTAGEDRVLRPPHLGRHLRAAHGRATRRARHPADGPRQHRGAAHGVHLHRRLPPRHDDRHLRRRPRRHHPEPDRPGDAARRPRPARPHLPAALRATAAC